MNTVSRRNFLKVSGLGIVNSVFPSIFTLGHTTRLAYRKNPFGLMLLKEFAIAVGASLVANEVYDWINNQLNTNDAKHVDATNQRMINGNFDDFSNSTVYQTQINADKIYCYTVGNVDQFNFCGAFVLFQPKVAILAEGPAILGFHTLAMDWNTYKSTSSVSMGEALVPKNIYEDVEYGSQFEKSFIEPQFFQTHSGDVGINWDVNSRGTEGRLTVQAQSRQGDDLFAAREYTVPLG